MVEGHKENMLCLQMSSHHSPIMMRVIAPIVARLRTENLSMYKRFSSGSLCVSQRVMNEKLISWVPHGFMAACGKFRLIVMFLHFGANSW